MKLQEDKHPALLTKILEKLNEPENEEYQKKVEDLDFIVTHDISTLEEVLLPKVISLNNLKPGEARFMRLRSTQVARIHKFNRLKNPH